MQVYTRLAQFTVLSMTPVCELRCQPYVNLWRANRIMDRSLVNTFLLLDAEDRKWLLDGLDLGYLSSSSINADVKLLFAAGVVGVGKALAERFGLDWPVAAFPSKEAVARVLNGYPLPEGIERDVELTQAAYRLESALGLAGRKRYGVYPSVGAAFLLLVADAVEKSPGEVVDMLLTNLDSVPRLSE